MKTARDLITTRAVTVRPDQRPRDVSGPIEQVDALYCVVVDKAGRFHGLVRLSELVTRSTERIFADLVATSPPLDVSADMEAALVIKLLQVQGRSEVVALDRDKKYIGLITRESVFAHLNPAAPRPRKGSS